MQFLGTGAAACIPCPFCECPICEEAREDPKQMRFRSMLLLDEKNLIDCGPDLAAATMRFGINLSPLENVYVTHSHQDHLLTGNSGLHQMSRTRKHIPVDVFLSEAAYEAVTRRYERIREEFGHMDSVMDYSTGRMRLHPVKIGVPFEQGGYRVMAVEGRHRIGEKENAIHYRFEKDGRKLLYACDTGLYPAESVELLRGSRIDILVLECNGDLGPAENAKQHMNLAGFAKTVDMLLEAEVIRPDTRIYATHFGHGRTLTMAQTQAWLDANVKLPVTMAHDGLKID